MRVLAIDTTSENGSLALLEDDQVVEELALPGPDGFAQLLFPAIQGLLQRHRWTLEEIDLFAAASGPGSFTGVRVGLTAVKGLAEATGRSAQAISNLQAIAAQGTAPLRMPLIDARRGEVYTALYDAGLSVVQPEKACSLAAALAAKPDEAQVVSRHVWPELSASGIAFRIEASPLAAMVGRIAVRQGGLDPAAIDANYVRRSDADGRWHDT